MSDPFTRMLEAARKEYRSWVERGSPESEHEMLYFDAAERYADEMQAERDAARNKALAEALLNSKKPKP